MESIFNNAKKYFENQEYHETIELCKNILNHKTDNRTLEIKTLRLISESFKLIGKTKEQCDSLILLLQIESDNYELAKDIGVSYQILGEYDLAKKYYKESLSINPKYASAMNNLGGIEMLSDFRIKAIHLFNQAIEYDPSLLQARLNLIKAYLKEGLHEKAAYTSKSAIDKFPNSFLLFYLYGKSLYLQKKLKEAEKAIQKSIDININYGDSFFQYSLILMDQNKLIDAQKSIEKAIQIEPKNYIYYNLLGIIFKANGDLEMAINHFKKALEYKPDFALALSNLGASLIDSDNLVEAEAKLRQAIKMNPSIAEPYINLGNMLIDNGNLTEAEVVILKAIEVKPDYALSHFILSKIYCAKGEYDKAEKEVEASLKYDSNNHIYEGELQRIKILTSL